MNFDTINNINVPTWAVFVAVVALFGIYKLNQLIGPKLLGCLFALVVTSSSAIFLHIDSHQRVLPDDISPRLVNGLKTVNETGTTVEGILKYNMLHRLSNGEKVADVLPVKIEDAALDPQSKLSVIHAEVGKLTKEREQNKLQMALAMLSLNEGVDGPIPPLEEVLPLLDEDTRKFTFVEKGKDIIPHPYDENIGILLTVISVMGVALAVILSHEISWQIEERRQARNRKLYEKQSKS